MSSIYAAKEFRTIGNGRTIISVLKQGFPTVDNIVLTRHVPERGTSQDAAIVIPAELVGVLTDLMNEAVAKPKK
jgi:hypothetical protein